jgi:hypothetical protein
LAALAEASGFAQTTLFSQDFNGSTVLTDYESPSPGIGQFTLVGAGGPGTTVSIEGGQLKMDRVSGNSGRFIRRADFPGPPLSLYVQFKISGTTSGSQTSAATFYIGQFSDNSPVAPAGEVHSRLAFTITGGGWQLREVGGSNDGQVITTPTQITWVINRAGRTLSYVSPGGGTSTVGDGKADVWVEGRLAFNEIGAVTASQNLTQLKFYFINGTGTLFFDDFLIRDVSGSLPVELTAFRAESSDDGTVTLRWATAQERNSRYFAVERSADLRAFTEIVRLAAAGTATEARQYEATDPRPRRGTNYYRLRQVDFDGREQTFRPVAVAVRRPETAPLVYPNPSDGWELWLDVNGAAEVSLFDFSGKRIAALVTTEAGSLLRLRPALPLPSGVYFVQLTLPDGPRLVRWVVE